MCVRLEKNDRDLGFSLEGGVGSSLGNRPLSVQKVFQGESSNCTQIKTVNISKNKKTLIYFK